MAKLTQEEKDAEKGVNYDGDGVQLGIASPLDCWELIGSSPGSPLPEARGDVTALEEAVAAACSSGSLLEDNCFKYAHSLIDDGALPISTAMADKQNDEDDGHSSERSEGLVFIAPVRNDSAFHGDHVDNAELMSNEDCLRHDDLSSCGNKVCYDDQVQQYVDVFHDPKWYEESVVYSADRWHGEEDSHFDGCMLKDCGNAPGINQSGNLCSAAGDVCAFTISSGLESPSGSPMSEYGMVGDSNVSMHQALADGRSSTLMSEETSREASRQARETVDAQFGSIDAYDKRQCKGFVCVSWIWTHLLRWQTQLGRANTLWSVAFTAAVMGILFLGRRWQCLQAQNHSLRSQLWAKEKRITQLMFQLIQIKDSLVKVRRVPVICVKPPLQVPQDNF